jgi:hypothetical protein
MEWTIITAISTAVIAVFAVSNFILAYHIKKLSERQQSEFSDLLQGLIVATVISSGLMLDDVEVQQNKIYFNRNYSGKTPIFTEDK